MKSNYLCLIELLNFDKIVSAFGNDMLQITINKISKDLATALAGSEHEVSCCNFGDSVLIQTESDSDEELSKLVRVLSAYNKQALMFGYPHKGIVLKQTSVVSLCDAIKTYNSKALFDAKAVLKEQNFAGIVINSDLYCEKQIFSRKRNVLAPGEMETVNLKCQALLDCPEAEEIIVKLEEA